MKLFHTSPGAIDEIKSGGRFSEFLFFSTKPYSMAQGDVVTYSIDLDDDQFIDAGQLFYHEDAAKLDDLVAQFCSRFDVETDDAEEIIAERSQLDSADADDSWDVQGFTARAAKLLGFRAVRVTDEQGSAYMIDMLGHESDLHNESEESELHKAAVAGLKDRLKAGPEPQQDDRVRER